MSGHRGAPAPSPPLPGDPGAGAPHRVPAGGATARAAVALTLALAATPTAVAQTALSADHNALWRVDLRSRATEVVVGLNDTDPRFSCHHLTVSSTGLIRCAREPSLLAIDPTSGEITELAALPTGSVSGGLAFDAADRLWYLPRNGTDLLRLDPANGLVVQTQPVSLVGAEHYTLAALGERLYALTRAALPTRRLLEEIDPATGASLSAAEITGVYAPVDAAFDEQGGLWVVDYTGEIILGLRCYNTSRIAPVSLEVELVWSECIFVNERPAFTNIADLRGPPVLVIPALDRRGMTVLVATLILCALLTLRRSAA
jgi:hypothetical protein